MKHQIFPTFNITLGILHICSPYLHEFIAEKADSEDADSNVIKEEEISN